MSEPPYLLDTSVVLHLVRGNDLGQYIEDRHGLSKSLTRPLICIVTHGEARVLACRNG